MSPARRFPSARSSVQPQPHESPAAFFAEVLTFPAFSSTAVPSSTAGGRFDGIVAEGVAATTDAAGAVEVEKLLSRRRKQSTRGGRSFFQWNFRAKNVGEVQHKYVVN